MKSFKICLITPSHIASNPRLVKEANALHEAGFSIKVIAYDVTPLVRPLDETLLSQVGWQCVRVTKGNYLEYALATFYQRCAEIIFKMGQTSNLSITMWAHSRFSHKLAKVAAAEPADLYIAHCLAALPAAYIAAQKHKAKLGFDAEDFHTGELADTPENQTEIAIRDRIERTLLPHCHHLTAASPMIAQAYRERYGVKMETILNVFPLSEAPDFNDIAGNLPVKSEPSLYWFSQTIGSGRGLEAIIIAMGQMKTPVNLYLRGTPSGDYAEILMELATEIGVRERIHLLPSAPPSEMVKLACEYDVGLCLELSEPFNRAICLTNKIFTYLLAGLPVLMSDTVAQKELALKLGNAAVVVDIYNPKSIAIALDKWFSNLLEFKSAKMAAITLGQEIYNWDVEKLKFLSIVERALR